jgi:hydrogenase maturation protease
VPDLSLVERIVKAVLYEGYLLYPYRPSAVKNRQRWNFGVIYPQAYSLRPGAPAAGVEAWSMQTECLVQGSQRTRLDVRVRFLHLLTRQVGEVLSSQSAAGGEQNVRLVETLEVGGQLFHTWQEAVERETRALALPLSELIAHPQWLDFTFPARHAMEALHDPSGRLVGVIIRQQQAVTGALEIAAAATGEQLFTLTVRILNLTPWTNSPAQSHDAALLQSLVSTHTIVNVHHGAGVSLLDPPAACRAAAAACRNVGTWPVLVGEAGTHDCLLSSPIILYDYPRVAPESAGDFFDATEIDELLTLRIMALTDAEKREMRAVDARARQILERTEALPVDHLRQLHGAVRGLRVRQEEQL